MTQYRRERLDRRRAGRATRGRQLGAAAVVRPQRAHQGAHPGQARPAHPPLRPRPADLALLRPTTSATKRRPMTVAHHRHARLQRARDAAHGARPAARGRHAAARPRSWWSTTAPPTAASTPSTTSSSPARSAATSRTPTRARARRCGGASPRPRATCSPSSTPTSSTTRRTSRPCSQPILDGDARVVYGARSYGGHAAYSFWFVLGNKMLALWASRSCSTPGSPTSRPA